MAQYHSSLRTLMPGTIKSILWISLPIHLIGVFSVGIVMIDIVRLLTFLFYEASSICQVKI